MACTSKLSCLPSRQVKSTISSFSSVRGPGMSMTDHNTHTSPGTSGEAIPPQPLSVKNFTRPLDGFPLASRSSTTAFCSLNASRAATEQRDARSEAQPPNEGEPATDAASTARSGWGEVRKVRLWVAHPRSGYGR